MGKKKSGKGPQGGAGPADDEDELAEGVEGVELEDGKTKSPAPAPFSFTPAPKGQSPASAGNFSFAAQPAAAPAGGGAFSFNFNAPAATADGEEDGDVDDQDDEEIDKEKLVEEFIKSLPEPVQACVAALNELDDEVSTLEAAYRKEMRELERKYEGLEAPIFEKRKAILSGEQKPDKADGTGVPDFWLGAMQNCSMIAANITEKDEAILKSLTNITSQTLPEETGIGFKLTFHFKENEFFTNKELTKTYFMADASDDPVLENAEGTEIDWAPGKNVTVKILKKNQRNKKGKGTRTVTKTEPCESFFNFFSPPKIPNPEEEPMEEEELEQRQMELESDYEMGIAFQERLVPHAIKWFTGEADDDEDDEDYEDYDEEDMEGMDSVSSEGE
eukprot:1399950-Rhodomonas_salina.1